MDRRFFLFIRVKWFFEYDGVRIVRRIPLRDEEGETLSRSVKYLFSI